MITNTEIVEKLNKFQLIYIYMKKFFMDTLMHFSPRIMLFYESLDKAVN